jgi:hypothetical protein
MVRFSPSCAFRHLPENRLAVPFDVGGGGGLASTLV